MSEKMPESVFLLDDFEVFDNPAVDSYNMGYGSTEYIRADLHDALKAENERLRDALVWCSGSNDFAPGGKAREGWMRLCAPLLTPPTPKEGGET